MNGSMLQFSLSVFLLLSLVSNGEGQQEELLDDLLKNISWQTRLKSFVLEIEVHSQTERDHPKYDRIDLASQSGGSSYFESIWKVKIVSNHESGSFAVLTSGGMSALDLRSAVAEGQHEIEDNSESAIVISIDGDMKRYDLQGRSEWFGKRSKRDPIQVAQDITPGLNLPLLPLMLYQDSASDEEAIFETILEALIDARRENDSNTIGITSEEAKLENKPVKIWRIKQPGPDFSEGFRFVIGSDDFEKGMVLEFHSGMLKPEEAKAAFVNDEQLSKNYVASNKVTWKQFRSESSEEDWILPVSVMKAVNNRISGEMKGTINCSLDWKSLDLPEEKLFELDGLKELGTRYKKDINLKLRR